MDLMQAIKERRSIRTYKSNPVPDNMIQDVLEAARWAPSWANTQCWEYILVKDAETKKALAGTLPSANPAKPAITEAPIIIVACAQLEKSGYFKEKAATDKGDWFMFDLGLSTQNLVLAAHCLGLGTVHVGLFDAQAASKILSVPESMAIVELIPLGFPSVSAKVTARKELKDIISYDKYGQREMD